MRLLNIFKKRAIDFSEEKVTKLSNLINSLGDILIKTGFGFYVDQLSQIGLAAERHDIEAFKKLVISRELFGGSGAMWEIWIDDDNNRFEFENRFCDFVDHLKKMGIQNGRISQVRSSFK